MSQETVDDSFKPCRVDADTIRSLREAIPGETDVQALADLFRVLGDPSRLRLLSVLQHGPMCVNDLASVLGLHQTAVSHQLKALRQNRLVRYEREGKMAIYSLDDDHVYELFRVALDHARE